MRRVREGLPWTVPGRIHRGSQGPVVRRALFGMEAWDGRRELVLCRLLEGQAGHRFSDTHATGARSPQGFTAGSGARQPVSPTLGQMVRLRRLRLLLHWSRQGLASRQLRLRQGQLARRSTQGSEGVLPHAARTGESVEERPVECEIPVQNMPSPGVGEDAMGNRAVAVVAQ